MRRKKKVRFIKKLNKSMEKNERFIMFIFMLAGFCYIFYGVASYYIGFHNLDSAQNYRWIEATYNLSFRDLTSEYRLVTMEEGYVMGSNQQDKGAIMLLQGGLLLGVFIGWYIMRGGIK